jgi:uncharacterized membrane protein
MAFCPNCGASAEGRFCQKCGSAMGVATPGAPPPGAVPPSSPPPGYVPQPASAGMTDNAAGALCYLFGLITGILFLVLAPYSQNRNIRFHAFQSIFLNIAWIVVWIGVTIIALILHVVPVLGAIISILLHFCLWIFALILWLYMMFKTYNGEKIVLPVIGAMAEKQANAS